MGIVTVMITLWTPLQGAQSYMPYRTARPSSPYAKDVKLPPLFHDYSTDHAPLLHTDTVDIASMYIFSRPDLGLELPGRSSQGSSLRGFSEIRDKHITQVLDAARELLTTGGIPCGAILARDRVISNEANVEYILAIMPDVAIETLVREAEIRKGYGCFTGRRPAIGVSPYAVILRETLAWALSFRSISVETHQLSVADDSHDAQGLHPLLLRVEGGRVSLVAEDHVWVKVGVQVRDAVAAHGVFESGLALAGWVVRASPGLVVGAVTVDIHVVVVAVAFQEDSPWDITTVLGAPGECIRQGVGAGPSLPRCQYFTPRRCWSSHLMLLIQSPDIVWEIIG